MATESMGGGDYTLAETVETRPRRREESFDATLGPGCMMWFMIIGIGSLGVVIIIWILSTGIPMINR